jgi:hypothetical protein
LPKQQWSLAGTARHCVRAMQRRREMRRSRSAIAPRAAGGIVLWPG